MNSASPTMALRWVRPRKVVGDLFSQSRLQQQWRVLSLCSCGCGTTRVDFEWRDIPVAMDEP